jgi:hypothetical protein
MYEYVQVFDSKNIMWVEREIKVKRYKCDKHTRVSLTLCRPLLVCAAQFDDSPLAYYSWWEEKKKKQQKQKKEKKMMVSDQENKNKESCTLFPPPPFLLTL